MSTSILDTKQPASNDSSKNATHVIDDTLTCYIIFSTERDEEKFVTMKSVSPIATQFMLPISIH